MCACRWTDSGSGRAGGHVTPALLVGIGRSSVKSKVTEHK